MSGEGACPTCRRPANLQYRPFCGRRCADVDLHRWLSGVYATPIVEDDESQITAVGEASDDLSD